MKFILTLILLLCVSTAAFAAETGIKSPEKVVILYQNKTSHLLAGDSDLAGGKKGEILPHLLKNGWSIKEIACTGAAAASGMPDQVVAIIVLKKK